MHDSRRAADLLFHQFKVTLCNVFDTMVADAKIQGDENYGKLKRAFILFRPSFSNFHTSMLHNLHSKMICLQNLNLANCSLQVIGRCTCDV